LQFRSQIHGPSTPVTHSSLEYTKVDNTLLFINGSLSGFSVPASLRYSMWSNEFCSVQFMTVSFNKLNALDLAKTIRPTKSRMIIYWNWAQAEIFTL